jgi:esterase
MELHYRKMGEGSPLIILHGLYGSSDNWYSIGKVLAERYTVYLVDQRNHGRSPHSKEHTYSLMRDDLKAMMDRLGIEKAIIVGHSMGGKTSMFFAVSWPERIESLVVVDISPRSYKSLSSESPQVLSHLNIIQSLYNLDLAQIKSRTEAGRQLFTSIPDERVRQFLLKSLMRDKDNHFSWAMNLDAIRLGLPDMMDGLPGKMIEKGEQITGFPVLFIRGELSGYIGHEDIRWINALFPAADIVTIPNAGHWVHAEQQELFLKTLIYFLDR